MLRSDIRTRVRDYLYEATADKFSDDQLNRLFDEEVRSLPGKNVFLEEIWTMTSVVDQQDYTLPTGTHKVEKLERNDGSTDKPDWTDIKGWDKYAGALFLAARPTQADAYRAFLKKSFTIVTDDTTTLDIPDDVSELVVWGVVVRGYKMLIGYLRNNQSWDSVTKPGDLSIPVVAGWLRDAQSEYKDLLKQYATTPRPRDINLVG